MTAPQQTFGRVRPMAARIVHPRAATLVLLLAVVGRGLLLVCGVSLFVAVAASDGQVLDDAWHVLLGR